MGARRREPLVAAPQPRFPGRRAADPRRAPVPATGRIARHVAGGGARDGRHLRLLEPPLRSCHGCARHPHQDGAARGRARMRELQRGSAARALGGAHGPGRAVPRLHPVLAQLCHASRCPAPAPASARGHRRAEARVGQPAPRRAGAAAAHPLGRRPARGLDARRGRRAGPGRGVRGGRARALRRGAQPPRPAGNLAPLAVPALRGNRAAPMPRGSARRGRGAPGGTGLGRQLRPGARLARVRPPPAASLSAHAHRPARRPLRGLPVGA